MGRERRGQARERISTQVFGISTLKIWVITQNNWCVHIRGMGDHIGFWRIHIRGIDNHIDQLVRPLISCHFFNYPKIIGFMSISSIIWAYAFQHFCQALSNQSYAVKYFGYALTNQPYAVIYFGDALSNQSYAVIYCGYAPGGCPRMPIVSFSTTGLRRAGEPRPYLDNKNLRGIRDYSCSFHFCQGTPRRGDPICCANRLCQFSFVAW